MAALAEVLAEARRRGEDVGAADVLARYGRWRRFDTGLLAVATDGLNRLFSNDNPVLRLGRDLGLGAVNRLPALRRRLIAEAAGTRRRPAASAARRAALDSGWTGWGGCPNHTGQRPPRRRTPG